MVGDGSVQANLRNCRSVWRQVGAALTLSSLRSQRLSNRHRVPAPVYCSGQKVWLSSKDLPLQAESKKLAVRLVGPFEVDNMVNVVAVHLRLLASLKIYPTFHVSWIKLVLESELVPLSNPPPPAWTVNQRSRSGVSWTFAGMGGSIWWIGTDTALTPHPGQSPPTRLLPRSSG